MRPVALLVLAFGSSALCQSVPPSHVDPDALFQFPQKYNQAGRDVAQFPRGFDPAKMPASHTVFVEPEQLPEKREIDPGIILRPPADHNRREGQPVAQNLYPDLRLVPIR